MSTVLGESSDFPNVSMRPLPNYFADILLCVAGGYLNTNLALMFYWLRYVSIFSYSLSALAVIEFQCGSPFGFEFLLTFDDCL